MRQIPDDDDVVGHSVPYISLAIIVVFITLGLTWAVQGNEFFLAKVFAPKMEENRRKTFEESKAYNEGMAQELRRMQMEYVKAAPEQKGALASIILHQTAGYDTTKLPPDLKLFLDEIQKGQGLK